jgi:predicted Zn-dependent protease
MASKHSSLLSWAFLSLLALLFLFPVFIESHPLSSSHSHLPKDHLFKKLEGCRRGQTVQGINEVKQYLHKFGYLSHQSINSEDGDFFDDSLESAIKTYQLNFNLIVTGALDADTVKQMAMPRCGVPDIVDGRNTMRPRNELHLGGSGLRIVSRYSFFPGAPKWPSNKYHLYYGFLNTGRVPVQIMRSVCASAFNRWAVNSPFTFSEVANVNYADITIGFFSGDHGDGYPFDGTWNTLAHAFAPTDGRLHFDYEEYWATDLSPNTFDLESVAVHEIGHLLGLDHSNDQNAIMYPTIPPAVRKVNLGQDDINGLRALYGFR